MMLRRTLAGAAGAVFVLAIAALASAPADLRHRPESPVISGSPSDYVAGVERTVASRRAIIPGTEKRLRWFRGNEGARTPFAVVYLHGFSATRQEIAPVGEQVADAVGANLFETRLAGHGLEDRPLADVRAEDWLDDAVESLAVGSSIGDRIILIGTSTGASLALAVSDHELFGQVDTVVMISPNFAPRDDAAEMLLRPGGPQLARLMIGAVRSWQPHNALQERFWTTSYPTRALVEMMRLVERARSRLPLRLDQSLLTLYSPDDQVIDVDRIRTSLAQISSPRMQTIEFTRPGDPSNHVLAGDILAPGNNAAVARHIVDFVAAAER